MNNSVYVILFFLGSIERPFMKNENLIIEEINNHIKSKIIYVINNSSPYLDEEDKEDQFYIINNSLHCIIPMSHKEEMLRANINNVVFVNFHKSKYGEPFGKKNLFKKIHDFLISNEEIKNLLLDFNSKRIEEKVKILRKIAEEALFLDKIIGKIPIIGWALQKFV